MQNREQLSMFVTWWRDYCKGQEKSDAQEFIRRLLQAFGYTTILEAKGQFEVNIRISHIQKNYTHYADFVIPGLVLIEMKSRGENLARHYDQLYEYWEHLVPERPKYCILCNFDECGFMTSTANSMSH